MDDDTNIEQEKEASIRRKNQLSFCKICTNREFDKSKGIVCNKTGEQANFIDNCEHFEEDDTRSKIVLKDNSKRAKNIVYILLVICVVNLVALVSDYYQIELLEPMLLGESITESEAEANDLRQTIIGLLQAAMQICSAILFIMWFRRAYWNLNKIQGYTEHDESMASFSFLIPFVSLYRPFKIAKEIASGLKQTIKNLNLNYKPATEAWILALWWGLFLTTNIVANVAARLGRETLEEIIITSYGAFISDFIDVIAALVTIFMIQKVSKDEAVVFTAHKLIAESAKREE